MKQPEVVVISEVDALTPPPEDFGVEFLEWLRQVTERAWGMLDETVGPDLGPRWRVGTRWTGGLDDAAIARVEDRYRVRFPPEHRLFLQTLHSTTPGRRGVGYFGHDHPVHYEAKGIYDWLGDERSIQKAMENVADTMRHLPFEDDEEWQTTWVGCEPKPSLIPILGHRYVVADANQWVLSIMDEDAMIYGFGLRDYLLHELVDLLPPRP